MHRRFRSIHIVAALAVALFGILLPGPALAQGPGGGPGRPPFGPGGEPPGGPMDPARPVAVAILPLPLLDHALGLTEAQKTGIQAIQRQFREAMREIMPRPEPGVPPDPGAMRAAREKAQALEQKAARGILALLSEEQKTALKKLLRDADDFRLVGLPMEVVPRLRLEPAQREKIGDIAQKARKAVRQALDAADDPREGRQAIRPLLRRAHEDALEVLTAEQRELLATFRPRGRPEGPPPLGPGGPPPGGPDGPPPPPEGGPGGPPPESDGQ